MERRDVRFHPRAEAEANRAYGWYYERNPAAARAFLADMDHAVSRVQESPERWPYYYGTAQRYIFLRFPFSLIYRVTDDAIEVIAIAHHSRRPGYWSQR
jgi:plasmid stabilization system protein ParE